MKVWNLINVFCLPVHPLFRELHASQGRCRDQKQVEGCPESTSVQMGNHGGLGGDELRLLMPPDVTG